MSVNYKKELESAAKGMILVHEPSILIDMILHMLTEKIKINHASILLHDKEKDAYILTDSRGSLGSNIPVGLVRMDKDDALLKFFREQQNRFIFKSEVVNREKGKELLADAKLEPGLRTLLSQVVYQMELLETTTCIPSYFRDELLGVFLLGEKNNRKKFSRQEIDFFVALASNVAMALRNVQLFKSLESELDQKRQLFIRIIVALAAAIEAKDLYTHGHTTRVTNISMEIAKQISQNRGKEFNKQFLEELQIASLLHDIGKIGIPESILNKNGPLDEQERIKIKEHPLIGVNILQPIKELDDSILGVRYHHERYDGLGYPDGLKGDNIPLIASIISVADSFDAMTSDRPYRKGLDKGLAINEIKNLRGTQFHPLAVDAFVQLCMENRI